MGVRQVTVASIVEDVWTIRLPNFHLLCFLSIYVVM